MNTKEIAAKLNWAMQAVPLAKEQKDVIINIILQLAEELLKKSLLMKLLQKKNLVLLNKQPLLLKFQEIQLKMLKPQLILYLLILKLLVF